MTKRRIFRTVAICAAVAAALALAGCDGGTNLASGGGNGTGGGVVCPCLCAANPAVCCFIDENNPGAPCTCTSPNVCD